MEQDAFQAAQPSLDEIAKIVEDVLDSEQGGLLQQTLIRLADAVGDCYSVSLDVTVKVFDRDGGRALPLLTTGLAISDNKEPYRTCGDSSPQRYIVDGQIKVVPHDHCPKCWEVWDFKMDSRICPHCGTSLGTNCKILLDSDVCPHCEKGRVSMSNPACGRCGYKVDLSVVTWG